MVISLASFVKQLGISHSFLLSCQYQNSFWTGRCGFQPVHLCKQFSDVTKITLQHLFLLGIMTQFFNKRDPSQTNNKNTHWWSLSVLNFQRVFFFFPTGHPPIFSFKKKIQTRTLKQLIIITQFSIIHPCIYANLYQEYLVI